MAVSHTQVGHMQPHEADGYALNLTASLSGLAVLRAGHTSNTVQRAQECMLVAMMQELQQLQAAVANLQGASSAVRRGASAAADGLTLSTNVLMAGAGSCATLCKEAHADCGVVATEPMTGGASNCSQHEDEVLAL